MTNKNNSIQYAENHFRRRLVLAMISILVTLCQLGIAFAWFATSNVTKVTNTSITTNEDSWSFSDSAYYKFKSQPFSATAQQIYLNSYDYVIAENNANNNVFIVFEVEVLSSSPDFRFEILTDEEQLFTKQYSLCNVSSAMSNVRGAPEYSINQIKYPVYYFNTASQQYVVCDDYAQVSYSGGQYLYGSVPCYYSTFFLSDCLSAQFCCPEISSIPELQNKTTVGGLTSLSNLYVSLTSYFDAGSYTADTFVDAADWSKKTTITFNDTITANKIKTIGSRRFIYLALNLKYSSAVMANTHPTYSFARNINQLFISDIRFELR